MKKAILIFPIVNNEPVQYPTGLYRIASHCSHEYEINVLDQRIDDDFYDTIDNSILSDDLLCIGISIMTGKQIKYAIEISERYKSRTTIVFGGVHPTMLPDQTFDSGFTDYIIVGEGEEAFLNLLRFIDNRADESAMFYSKDNKDSKYNYLGSIDENEYIDFGKYPIREEYFIRRDGMERAFTLETSRGCPHKCKYCHNNAISDKPYRLICADNITKIINDISGRYNIDGIVFQEDNFFASAKRVKKLISYFANNALKWKANSRIDYFRRLINNDKFMNSLVQSGCTVLQFGIESGSQDTLDYIDKDITIEDVISINKELHRYDIKIRYNFMIGFPNESTNDIEMTLDLINILMAANDNVEPPFLNVYTPYPGTPLYNDACKLGFNPPKAFQEWADTNWNSSNGNWRSNREKEYLEELSNKYYEKVNYLKG